MRRQCCCDASWRCTSCIASLSCGNLSQIRGSHLNGTSLTSKMPPAPLYVRTSLPLVTDHMWRFLSKDPEARSSPLGENATEYTGCVCCVRWCKHSPVSPFHSLHRAAIPLRGSHVKSWLTGAWRYSNHPKVYTI